MQIIIVGFIFLMGLYFIIKRAIKDALKELKHEITSNT